MAHESEVAKGFARLLVALLEAKGYVSRRNKSGVDVTALAKGAGVSYEMARGPHNNDKAPRQSQPPRTILQKIRSFWLQTATDNSNVLLPANVPGRTPQEYLSWVKK